MQNDKLLPCPFCGGEAKQVTFHDRFEDSTNIYIKCTECNAQTKELSLELATSQGFNPYEAVIIMWNTRKPMERIVERLEELFKHHNATKQFKD